MFSTLRLHNRSSRPEECYKKALLRKASDCNFNKKVALAQLFSFQL